MLWLVQKIIFQDPTKNYLRKGLCSDKFLIPESKSLFSAAGEGLPIGNLTSQFFANIYLNELDQFITHQLAVTRYIRYVDDFVIFDADKEKLRSYIQPIATFLKEKLNLSLNGKKIILRPAAQGLDFLGYFIKPSYVLVRRKVVCRFKQCLWQFQKQSSQDNRIVEAIINSYLGHFIHANSFNLRKQAGEYWFPQAGVEVKTDKNFSKVKIEKRI